MKSERRSGRDLRFYRAQEKRTKRKGTRERENETSDYTKWGSFWVGDTFRDENEDSHLEEESFAKGGLT